MSFKHVSSLQLYPIKSTSGISVEQTHIDALGATFDRRFVLSDLNGQCITARTDPTLCLVKTSLNQDGLQLTAPNMPTLIITYDDLKADYQDVNIWGDTISAQICTTKANDWFSQYLQRPCQLLFFGKKSLRIKKANTTQARTVAFADGYPLLLISQASLDDLNERLIASNVAPVSMDNFRPNIVIDNTEPFAEDSWQHIKIGEVEFKVSKPCERCIFTTVNPITGEKNPHGQPLLTLKNFRQTVQGEVLFGQNLIPLNEGNIKRGDKVDIISTKISPIFMTHQDHKNNESFNEQKTPKTTVPTINKKITITFDKWQKDYVYPPSKNQNKTILELGEDAGLILPYSCRAGMCGHCKAKLKRGEVDLKSQDGLSELERQQGYILCCSAIPKNNVTISHD